ncbi:MAG: hypothetical protein L0J48_06195 [Alkalibacterium sp.]|uniref:Uncharacterized protein n=1 Tax=Alkalibacterium gilvum TaxID=1130080 RepID=A0A1H6UUP7_9LACT|nr:MULTISPECIES: hypothetical protein [Alkalibacterium]MDN6293715.1 hypothetical protein [Alkalibacterium sp.]MDN6295425.1 hypothetical protein [Alkalibacterium sp.]MDN6327603.1 hypothetical protein [Alkalibacterium sp.]MDN6397715.1 hypothetical protein [Alkalibacterium sp.]SEI95941.1 hypothetical protein SAMN04488113_1382 [Alkalibacterium gilvum]
MKKLSKIFAMLMMGGMLLVGCGEADNNETDIPDVDKTEEDLMNDDLDDQLEDDAE